MVLIDQDLMLIKMIIAILIVLTTALLLFLFGAWNTRLYAARGASPGACSGGDRLQYAFNQYVQPSPSIPNCEVLYFKVSGNKTERINGNGTLGNCFEAEDRYFAEYSYSSQSRSPSRAPAKPQMCIMYFHGYSAPFTLGGGNTGDNVGELMGHTQGSVILVSMRGNLFNGMASWNVNTEQGVGLGTGYNYRSPTAALESCVKPSTTSPEGGCPGASGCAWTSCADDVQFVKTVKKHYESLYGIPVHPMGFSNGALFTLSLLFVHKVFNRGVTFAGGIPFGMYVPTPGVGLLDFHGTEDGSIPGVTSSRSLQCAYGPSSAGAVAQVRKSWDLPHPSTLAVICDQTPQKWTYHEFSNVLEKIGKKGEKIQAKGTILSKMAEDISSLAVYQYGPDVFYVEGDWPHGLPHTDKGVYNQSFILAYEFLKSGKISNV